jgi:alpha-L-rhamnosidase
MDGSKRDRLVWSGDLSVSAPTVYYSSGATDAVAGSLRLHGSYQRSSGQVPGNLPPQLRLGLAPGDALPSTYYYSLSYSIYFVTSLYEYYLYTGDKDFVRWAWPVVQKDLAYVHNTTNAQHLVVTDASNDSDWHPHEAARIHSGARQISPRRVSAQSEEFPALLSRRNELESSWRGV